MMDYHVDSDGIAHIVWNNPKGSVNIKNDDSILAFEKSVEQTIENPIVKGAIVTSAKQDFIAGGDLTELYAIQTHEHAAAKVERIGRCLRHLETSGKPFVAAINGSALGGGLEVALACHHRIAVQDPRLKLGLPEVSMGLIPGAGGTQRLPRLVGIATATNLLLSAKPIGAEEAHDLGLIDELVSPGKLHEAARSWILDSPETVQPWDRKNFRYPDFEPQSLEGKAFFFNAWPQLRRRESPDDFASGAVLHVLGQSLQRNIDAGLTIERRFFSAAVVSKSAKNRIRTLFLAPSAVRKKASERKEQPFKPKRAGIIGAGLMGSGIAQVCANAGIETILIDANLEHSKSGYERISKSLENSVKRSFIDIEKRDQILSKLRLSDNLSDLKGCDIILEAIVEVPAVKMEVLSKAMDIAGPDTLIASNTSTLSISKLAEPLENPENFIGLHFFAPVDRMQLVEVIRGSKTSDSTLNRALDFIRLLKKTSVVVNDGPGFYTSRVVASYTREALHLLNEGVSPALIDNAALNAGFPIGPLAMGDLTSYDLLSDILKSLEQEGLGTAAESHGALEAIRKLLEHDRSGRKAGGGVYDYHDGGKSVWKGMADAFPASSCQPHQDEVIKRLLHIQSLETLHVLSEGVASDPLEIDTASVLGWSYPVWRGGVLAHIDDCGLDDFINDCNALAARHGNRFKCPDAFLKLRDTNHKFHAMEP